LTEVTTKFVCEMMQIAFFKNEGLEDLFGEWAGMKMEIETEGEPETTKDNILEGYDVIKVEYTIKEKETKDKISKCVIDGPEESDMVINYY